MNRLQLATILSWSDKEGIHGRKRMQKVIYLLQQAGCPLDCQFILHHYGPYSRDVADRCDEMVAAGLIGENGGPANGDWQYSYSLKPETKTVLVQSPDTTMQQFQTLGKDLINENLWTLELGSTILYFYRQTENWDDALSQACDFKKVSPHAEESQKALKLANAILIRR